MEKKNIYKILYNNFYSILNIFLLICKIEIINIRYLELKKNI